VGSFGYRQTGLHVTSVSRFARHYADAIGVSVSAVQAFEDDAGNRYADAGGNPMTFGLSYGPMSACQLSLKFLAGNRVCWCPSTEVLCSWQWKISGGPLCNDGWIVQHVRMMHDRRKCADGQQDLWSARYDPLDYWEAWHVVNGAIGSGGRDYFDAGAIPNTCRYGWFSIHGWATLYRPSINLTWPATVPEAGGLPSTYQQPTWWEHSDQMLSGVTTHNSHMGWHCCHYQSCQCPNPPPNSCAGTCTPT
jgi:hypothetical protein